jgi:hypothetical protein
VAAIAADHEAEGPVAQAAHAVTSAAAVVVRTFEDLQAQAAQEDLPDLPAPNNASVVAAAAVVVADPAVVAVTVLATDAVVIVAILGARNPKRICRKESTPT